MHEPPCLVDLDVTLPPHHMAIMDSHLGHRSTPVRVNDSWRVLVTASRHWSNTALIRAALAWVWHPNAVLVHGDCRGGDKLADACWRAWGGQVEPRPADWFAPCQQDCRHGGRRFFGGRGYCPTAGPRRNALMVDQGAAVCLAFLQPSSRGAASTAMLAERAGIPTLRLPDETYALGAPRSFFSTPV